MKFIFDGDYACKDGVTFLFGNPTTVENEATIEKLLKDPHFRVANETPIEGVNFDEKHTCPKCGRYVKRGLFVHQKYCKGVK